MSSIWINHRELLILDGKQIGYRGSRGMYIVFQSIIVLFLSVPIGGFNSCMIQSAIWADYWVYFETHEVCILYFTFVADDTLVYVAIDHNQGIHCKKSTVAWIEVKLFGFSYSILKIWEIMKHFTLIFHPTSTWKWYVWFYILQL